jgi:hypothetical protein
MSATAMSTLGIVHTIISLVAVGAGVRALLRYKAIGPGTGAGALYIVMTILTCVTGFFIFAHGGFGKPHALGVITLLTLGVAGLAGFTKLFGRASAAVETVAYSLSFFFHLIPLITETSTRLPASAPLLDNPDAPELQAVSGVLFLLFLAGSVLQVRRLRAAAANPLGASVRTV